MGNSWKLRRCVALLAELRAIMSGPEGCWCHECLKRWARRIDRALEIPTPASPAPAAGEHKEEDK